MPRVRAVAALCAAGAVLVQSGCGDGGEPGTTAATPTTATVPASATAPAPGDDARRFTTAEVAELAGFTAIEGGRAWEGPTGCRVTEILISGTEVKAALKEFSTLVVTNPAGDVGVRFEATAGCREALTANLSAVK